MESQHPHVFEIGRESDESQGNTTPESTRFNPCDGVRYCDPHQGATIKESTCLDGSNGAMKDDFRGITRGKFMAETPIKVRVTVDVKSGMFSVGK